MEEFDISFILLIHFILIILELPFDGDELLLDEVHTTSVPFLFVFLFNNGVFGLDFLVELLGVVIKHISDCLLLELLESRYLSLLMEGFEIFDSDRELVVSAFLHTLIIQVDSLIHCFVTLILADITPSILYVRHCTLIDTLHVTLYQSTQHFSIKLFVIQGLYSHSIQNLLSEVNYLFEKLRSQFIKLQFIQILKILLVRQWSHQSNTVPFFEESGQQSSDPVFGLD